MPSKTPRKRSCPPLTADQKADLIQMAQAGRPCADIAKHFNMARKSVYNILIGKGACQSRMSIFIQELNFLLETEPTLTQMEISDLLKCSSLTVLRAMKGSGWIKYGGRKRGYWMRQKDGETE